MRAIGLESLNPRNLAAATKRQNRVGDFAAMISAWRAAGILTHAGYIIGFPDDTADSVREDVAALRDDVQPDVASFFMLTPLAGSADYARLLGGGAVLDDDLNRHDTFHPVLDHPRMSRAAWYAAYRQAWTDFYTDHAMRQRLRHTRDEQHITLLQIYFWYLASTVVEQFHPMMTGFVRLKPRADRRPGAPVDGRLRHALRRTAELGRQLAGYAQIARRLQRLWCETRRGATGNNTLRDHATFLRAMLGPISK